MAIVRGFFDASQRRDIVKRTGSVIAVERSWKSQDLIVGAVLSAARQEDIELPVAIIIKQRHSPAQRFKYRVVSRFLTVPEHELDIARVGNVGKTGQRVDRRVDPRFWRFIAGRMAGNAGGLEVIPTARGKWQRQKSERRQEGNPNGPAPAVPSVATVHVIAPVLQFSAALPGGGCPLFICTKPGRFDPNQILKLVPVFAKSCSGLHATPILAGLAA